jgi:hypothetical protein
MQIEVLRARRAEIAAQMVQMANSYQIMIGHQNELDFQIAELEKAAENIVEPPVAE